MSFFAELFEGMVLQTGFKGVKQFKSKRSPCSYQLSPGHTCFEAQAYSPRIQPRHLVDSCGPVLVSSVFQFFDFTFLGRAEMTWLPIYLGPSRHPFQATPWFLSGSTQSR